MGFWEGFEKRASMPGVVSGLGHYGSRSAGRVIGARPSPMMATAAAFKPNAIPAPKPIAAATALAPKASHSVAPVPKQTARGASSVAI